MHAVLRWAGVASVLSLLLPSCSEFTPVPHELGSFTPVTSCDEYVFDSALANLETISQAVLNHAVVHHYAPPAENLMGWTQARYALEWDSPYGEDPGYDVIWLHGGGGDVGHATAVTDEVRAFVERGYDVWSVEYRRGWLRSSYDPCLPRDPTAATAEDMARLPKAAQLACGDLRQALRYIASRTTDSLFLFGTSFGASLALSTGPFGDPEFTDSCRIAAVASNYGGLPPSATPTHRVRTFLLHGRFDPIVPLETGPYFGLQAPWAVQGMGSRPIYDRISEQMPAWMLLHRHGHNFGPMTTGEVVDHAIRTALFRHVEPGAYYVDQEGIVPFE